MRSYGNVETVLGERKINLSPFFRIEVGDYVADLLVENKVLIELKAIKAIDDIHRAQCMNYLKATGHTVCLLINFGSPKLEVKRIVNNF